MYQAGPLVLLRTGRGGGSDTADWALLASG